MKQIHKILFETIRIGACELKNRYAMAPLGPAGLVDGNGAFTQNAVEFYAERARGGVGLIITGMSFSENQVEKHYVASMPCPTQNPMIFIRAARNLTERVHAYDAKIFLQLSAGFGRVANRVIPGEFPIGPSVIPYMWQQGLMCREISTEEIRMIIKGIKDSAVIAKKSGFDGVEIHAMHEGYLIDQFAIGFFNHRTDQYGGSLENRVRMATEIVTSIKAACGADYPVVMRYSAKSFMKGLNQGAVPGEDFKEKGRDLPEGLKIAKILENAGYDALNADAGCYDAWYWSHPPMYQRKGLFLEFNEQLKKVVSIPVLTSGRMDNPDLAAHAIEKGQTDIVSLGRPLLADSQIVNKIKRGDILAIRPCLSCQEACMGRLKSYMHISCAVNPAAAREKEFALTHAEVSKNVVVVGGGIAGCEAARVLTIRGHKVEIFEKSGHLGGNLIPGGAPSFKEDDKALVEWYKYEIKRLKVPVHYESEITAKKLEKIEADTIIVATGSKPRKLSLGDACPVFLAEEVLNGEKSAGAATAIIGGGLVGCELALMLSQKGVKVKIIEYTKDILNTRSPLCYANRQMLVDLLKFYDVEIYTCSQAVKTVNQGIVICNADGELMLAVDSVITAIGYLSRRELYNEIKDSEKEVLLVGDARQVSNIMYAVWDAYEIARTL